MAKKDKQQGSTSISTLDDIVFEHRNKKYGVYQLRKRYNQYLLMGFTVAFLLFGGVVAYPLIEAYKLKSGVRNYVEKRVVITVDSFTKNEEITPPPPPPPAPFDKFIRYSVPVIVDTAIEDIQLSTMDEQLKRVTNDVPPPQIVPEQKSDKNVIIEEDEPPVLVVEESAMFQGGDINTFRIWVQQHVVYSTAAIEANIQGKVFVQFAVNSRGQVVDVKVVRGVHPELDKEAIRCIMSSPRWIPAKQGGKAVKQQFVIPIVFALQ